MHTVFKDDEVRDTDIIDDAGNSYGIYISEPDARGVVQVTYSADGHKAVTIKTTINELDSKLEQAYSAVLAWITDSGNTRTTY
jgi:hypothetical protein